MTTGIQVFQTVLIIFQATMTGMTRTNRNHLHLLVLSMYHMNIPVIYIQRKIQQYQIIIIMLATHPLPLIT